MAGIAVGDLARRKVVDAVEHRDEHTVDRLFGEQVVGVGHTFGGASATDAGSPKQRTTHGHEDGSRNTLAANVGNHESDAVVVDTEEIIEVASHILGSRHRGCNVELLLILGERREDAWQDGMLYLLGDGQIALQGLELFAVGLHLTDIPYLLDRFLDRQTEVVEVDGLRGEVEGTVVHGLADITHIAVCRHHDALQCRVAHLVDLRQQGETIHLRHVDIRKDNVIVFVLQKHRQCFQSVMCKGKLVFTLADLPSEVLCQQQLEIVLVVDTENFYSHKMFVR